MRVERTDAGNRAALARLRNSPLVRPGKGGKLKRAKHPIARAIAYALTFTAQPGLDDLSRKLLAHLAEHDDRVTQEFSEWALGVRWDRYGNLRPVLYGATDAWRDEERD